MKINVPLPFDHADLPDEFGTMEHVTIVGDDAETGLLIDGEYEDGQLPLTCNSGLSSVNFLQLK